MKRLVPVELLELLENWLSNCMTCVKWQDVFSSMFSLTFGVRQGSVLSPFLFAVYLDDLYKSYKDNRGLYVFLYADDILCISPSISALETLLRACERELIWLDMSINVKKSCYLRIGPRNDSIPANISTLAGHVIPWVNEMRYLGINIKRSRVFKCSLDQPKRAFYRAANGLFGKIGRFASEDVVIQLLISKCMPVLLYGLEVCCLRKADLHSLDFVINRFCMKLFRTNNMDIIKNCQSYFDLKLPSEILAKRYDKFLSKLSTTSNTYCCSFLDLLC